MTYAPPPPPGPPPPGGPPGTYPNPYGGYGPPSAPIAPMPHPPRRGGTAIIAIFVGALVAIVVLVGIILLGNQPPAPPACPEGTLCPPPPPATLTADRSPQPTASLPSSQTPAPTPAGVTPGPGESPQPTPDSNAAPFAAGKVWRSQALEYSFEYDDGLWTLAKSEDAFAQLLLGPVEVDVIGYPSSTSVDAALEDVLKQTDNFLIGRAPNTRSYDALLGAGIGYVRGKGGVFSGTFKNADGTPGDTAGITVMASTKGKATVVVIVLVSNPDKEFGSGTLQLAARREVDQIVKTFVWAGGG